MVARSFQHIAPPLRLFSGPDSLGHLGRELDRAGRCRAVIFCGSTLAREDTLLRQVRAAMGDRCVGVFAAVRAHSPLDSVVAAARDLERLGADAVVPVGGGSAIVTARAASIILAEGGSVESLSTSRDESGRMRSPKLLAPKLPQFVVPTTPTTAIAKAGSAVFDPEGGRRLALFDPKTRAQSIFIQPALVASAPAALVMSAGLNTFSLAMEGLMSRRTEPFADALLMHALRLVRRNLPAETSIDVTAARTDLVLAAILCGQGTDYSGAGITTVLSHATGARHHLENGLLNAIFLPHVLRFNAEAARDGLANIAAALDMPGMDTAVVATKVADAVDLHFRALGVAGRLRDVGVPHEDLAEIAAHAMGDWFLRDSPRPVGDASELVQVLEEAW
jgi:alcohol dehydrogenase class IV